MTVLTFISNRSKGVNAYVAPIDEKTWQPDYKRNVYPEPETDEQQKLAYEKKAHHCFLDTANLVDGCYVTKSAVAKQGTRCHYRYLVVALGDVTDEFESLDDLVKHKAILKHGELPELTGSDRQVSWATNIRDGYLSKHDCPISPLPLMAKWWIDNRHDLGGAVDEVLSALDEDVASRNEL